MGYGRLVRTIRFFCTTCLFATAQSFVGFGLNSPVVERAALLLLTGILLVMFCIMLFVSNMIQGKIITAKAMARDIQSVWLSSALSFARRNIMVGYTVSMLIMGWLNKEVGFFLLGSLVAAQSVYLYIVIKDLRTLSV